ncbi:amidase [Paroceanicella profunda]|uniref:Amidase n=1 Tax=Paroceanicella profunda TaxID=2579971 RepID=A0A5B8FYR6_9RHOB|nr:amidase family protein [Paroceanicella profunda]QDL91819.1 amidase [Paroceanicella profunda]
MDKTLTGATACDLGRGIGAGEIDPEALTEHFLSAISAHPEAGRIYARTTPDRARAEAAAAARRARDGLRRGPLDGVPISWKDLFDTAGTATEAGSALLAGRTPSRDARVLERATRAGLVCLGKTHMSELAFSGIGINPVTATSPNVNDPDRVPGGSSSGAAASVAFGLAPAGIGSDTGGSVRVPAAWNDLVGFKTTHGWLPLDGVVPLAAGFDTVGPLCRSVEDAAALAFTMAGAPIPDLAGSRPDRLRLLVLETVALDDLRPEPQEGFERAVSRLAEAGAGITRAPVPCLADAMGLSATLFAGEAWAEWGETIEANPDVMFDQVRERFRTGRDVSAARWLRDRARMRALRGAWTAAVGAYDAVLVPSSPILPPLTERMMQDQEYYVRENLLALRNTRIGNLMDSCGVTLPTGVPSCGITALGLAGQDRAILRVAAAMEAVLAA